MKGVFLIIFLAVLTLFPLLSLAAGLVPCGGCAEYNADKTKCITAEPSCQFCHIFVLFKNIVDFLLIPCSLNSYVPIIPSLAVLMLAIAGFMYIFAYFGGGEIGGKGGPALLSQANKLLTSIVWGLLIIFGAWLIVNLFFQMIGVQSWTRLTDNPATSEKEGWWQINCPLK